MHCEIIIFLQTIIPIPVDYNSNSGPTDGNWIIATYIVCSVINILWMILRFLFFTDRRNSFVQRFFQCECLDWWNGPLITFAVLHGFAIFCLLCVFVYNLIC